MVKKCQQTTVAFPPDRLKDPWVARVQLPCTSRGHILVVRGSTHQLSCLDLSGLSTHQGGLNPLGLGVQYSIFRQTTSCLHIYGSKPIKTLVFTAKELYGCSCPRFWHIPTSTFFTTSDIYIHFFHHICQTVRLWLLSVTRTWTHGWWSRLAASTAIQPRPLWYGAKICKVDQFHHVSPL